MREILFRAKGVLKKDAWFEGYLVKTGDHFRISVMNDMVSYGVRPETVGQYTGLTDKNGKRIFEGDIVKIPDDYDIYGINAGEVYEVYFGFGGFRLKPKYRKNARGFFLEDDGEVEVIGNVHDHPELIAEVEG